jgi:hypothetical protein
MMMTIDDVDDDDDVTSGEVVRLRKVDLQWVTFVSTVRKVDR